MLTKEVLTYIDRSMLCWLATVGADGAPNVSPKEIFTSVGHEMLIIADIASPSSTRNVKVNSSVCVSFIDVFVQKGYKIRGNAEVVTPTDRRFRELSAPLTDLAKGAFPIRNVIAVSVSQVQPIVAPSYHMVVGTTEETQIDSAMAAYGVMPRSCEINNQDSYTMDSN